jgi:hypothetical protein
MCSFDGADLGTNSEVLVSFSVRCRNVCGMFVEHLLLYCFDITTHWSLPLKLIPSLKYVLMRYYDSAALHTHD